MRSLFLLIFALLSLRAQNIQVVDYYPEVRALLREAEQLTVSAPKLDNGRRSALWVVDLYARAGYLSDALRVSENFVNQDEKNIWHARILYGDLASVENEIKSITNPEQRVQSLTWMAHFLWRMDESNKAKVHLNSARQDAAKIVNPERRKTAIASIDREIFYLAEKSPQRLSAKPNPQKKFSLRDSPIPLFPITTDGFREKDPTETTNRANSNAAFMKELYARMEAGDRGGLVNFVEKATSPFQKNLALASIEHILIQANQPDVAEEYARKMLDNDMDSALAKAEALSAAGAAWLRANNSDRAHACFDAATKLITSVQGVPSAKISILTAMAVAQFKGGLVANCRLSLQFAQELSLALPTRPKTLTSNARNINPKAHYRSDAYKTILLAAIQVRDLGIAHEVSNLWSQMDNAANDAIVSAWLDADQKEEAISFARKISKPSERLNTLLVIARALLDDAGAPNI